MASDKRRQCASEHDRPTNRSKKHVIQPSVADAAQGLLSFVYGVGVNDT
jgi:hypothetical protein